MLSSVFGVLLPKINCLAMLMIFKFQACGHYCLSEEFDLTEPRVVKCQSI